MNCMYIYICMNNTKFCAINQALTWKKLLIPTEEESHLQSMYIKWRTTWLSPSRSGLLILAYISCFNVALASVYAVPASRTYTDIVSSVHMLWIIGWMALLLRRTPAISDHFNISGEVRLVIVAGAILTLLFIFMSVIVRLVSKPYSPLDVVRNAWIVWCQVCVVLYSLTQFRWRLLPDRARSWTVSTKRNAVARHQNMIRRVLSSNNEAAGNNGGGQPGSNLTSMSPSISPVMAAAAAGGINALPFSTSQFSGGSGGLGGPSSEVDQSFVAFTLTVHAPTGMDDGMVMAGGTRKPDGKRDKRTMFVALFEHEEAITLFAEFLSYELSIEVCCLFACWLLVPIVAYLELDWLY